jgi:DUF4097 and DUF4098 domain-containing protein YvlB
MTGRATEEWTRTYPLAPGGRIEITNINGRIDVEGSDVSQVEVRAERIVKAATNDAAKEFLKRLEIREDVQPDRVKLETRHDRNGSIVVGISYEVKYHVRAPRGADIRVGTKNGGIMVAGISGPVQARSTNGAVVGKGLTGGVDAETTNGGVQIDLAEVGAEPVELRTTNGAIVLNLPETARADISAACTNGGINVAGLQLETRESGRRRLEARMNGGGTRIALKTTNGGIRIRGRA